MRALIASLLLCALPAQAQWATSGIAVKDEGVSKGSARAVNCTGAGVTCSSNGYTWTLDVSSGGGPASWLTLTDKPATFPATVPVATATALAADPADCGGAGEFAKGVDASGVASGCAIPPGTYALPTASTTLGGVKQAAACGAGNHVASIVAGELTCTADAGGTGAPTTATYITQTADAGLSAEQALSSLSTGVVKVTNGTGVLSTAIAADLPGGPYLTAVTAHTLMGATHSDVDTAAANAGDLVVRNAANNQWGHQAVGGANTVLHGGATAPAYSAVADADLTGAVGVTHGGLGAAVTPAAGTIVYGSSGTAHAELAAGSAGQVLRSGGAGAPVWVGVQSCTSSAATTCTITVARSACVPVCMNSTAVSTWVRGTVATTTLTCTFSTSGTNTCNCLCP